MENARYIIKDCNCARDQGNNTQKIYFTAILYTINRKIEIGIGNRDTGAD